MRIVYDDPTLSVRRMLFAKGADGKWAVLTERPLKTETKFDVPFSDLSKRYGFGLAMFDNAQVRRAPVREPLLLVFDK